MRCSALALILLLAACWRNAPEPEPIGAAEAPAAEASPLELRVTVWRWACAITYPDGVTDSVLHVPAGRTVKMTVSTKDIDHDVEIESAKVDVHVEPGRTAMIGLRIDHPGQLAWKCPVDVPPGQAASDASHVLYVDSPAAFAQYLAPFEADLHPRTLADRIALGRKLYEQKGCVACHTIDGSPRVGPSLHGMFGSQITLANGTQRTIDEAAIGEALRTPNAFVRPGYPPVMPSYDGQLTPVQLDALVQFMRSIGGP